MRSFPLTYARWRLKMAINLVNEKREYLLLAIGASVMATLGGVALWWFGGKALTDIFRQVREKETGQVLEILFFALYVGFFFMALANVVTRFSSAVKMDEREQLMGPLPPGTLFRTELMDSLRLPLLVLVAGVMPPVWVALYLLEVPLWRGGVMLVLLTLLFAQPTLLVMGVYVGVVRYLPGSVLRSAWLLFGVFFFAAGIGAGALGTLRAALLGKTSGLAVVPSIFVARALPPLLEGNMQAVALQGIPLVAASLVLLLAVYPLYRYAFLNALERFGVQSDPGRREEKLLSASLLRRLLFRFLPSPVAALVHKDLRSSRRDTAQRVAFTALGAVVSALVLVDVVGGHQNAVGFLLILAPYALFLVSCQGLSTFSAEGGVLENLAQLPLEAEQILKAKIVGHALLYYAVMAATLGLFCIAPTRIPVGWRLIGALPLLLLGVPCAWLLSWLSVTLGALFPKPGQGGGRKEISVFAMGLFLQLLLLFALAVGASLALPATFGPWYGLFIPVVLVLFWGVFRFFHQLALRSVSRALGAEMKAG